MRFYKHLYVSDNLKEKTASIKMRLRLHKFQPGLFLLCLPEGSNELEYFSAVLLLQPYYKRRPRKDLFIIGLAESETECMNMIEGILKETLTSEYPCQIKKYLLAHQN